MITKINKILSDGLMCCGIAVPLTACTDSWDDHYESLGSGEGSVHEGTLWQAITSNPNLSHFAKVIEGCNYVDKLNGSQVFTVFAPTNDNLTEAEADQWISDYVGQKDTVLEENNTTLKEFIQNHMALYNHSYSPFRNDTLTLMNGKYAALQSDSTIDGIKMSEVNQLYSNGILNVINSPVKFFPNVFEASRKDADLEGVRSFLYNEHYYYKEFQEDQSVAGSIVNGKTQYLDSVFTQINQLYDYVGLINSEDSDYIMVAPTNKVWDELVADYQKYFDYPEIKDPDHPDLAKKNRDSLEYKMTRLAILQGTTFSRTFNKDTSLGDSAMSVNCIRNYNQRKSFLGAPFEYYQYYMPLAAKGALNQSEILKCSNGEVRKATEWNIDKRMTFHQYAIATSRNVKEVQKQGQTGGKDSLELASYKTESVASNNKAFYNKLWNNSFLEIRPTLSTVTYWINFIIPDVLSNIGYDIYIVTAPALAKDTLASDEERRPTKFSCKMYGPGLGSSGEKLKSPAGKTTFETRPDSIDYILISSNYKFKKCTRDLNEEGVQMRMRITNEVLNNEMLIRPGDPEDKQLYTRDLRINAILVVPHGSLEVVDELPAKVGTGKKAIEVPASAQGTPGIIMYPHRAWDEEAGSFKDDGADYKAWYMQR